MRPAKISKPLPIEYAPHYATYIKLVAGEDLIHELETGRQQFLEFIRSIPESKLNYRYAEDKWTIKEIIIHIMDTERIFSYRALRFSRNDATPVPGFDEDEYIPEANGAGRDLDGLLEEYNALRTSTIEFFKYMTAEMTMRTGIANNKEISVRSLAYVIVGHEIHHANVIKARYL
jgi:uncharacterized damage-inducible protein DinB